MHPASASPSPFVSVPLDQRAHRALDRCAQLGAAQRALAGLLAATEEFSSVARDDLAMLFALLAEPLPGHATHAVELAAARSAVTDLIGGQQELDGPMRATLHTLVSVLAQINAEAVMALSAALAAVDRAPCGMMSPMPPVD